MFSAFLECSQMAGHSRLRLLHLLYDKDFYARKTIKHDRVFYVLFKQQTTILFWFIS